MDDVKSKNKRTSKISSEHAFPMTNIWELLQYIYWKSACTGGINPANKNST